MGLRPKDGLGRTGTPVPGSGQAPPTPHGAPHQRAASGDAAPPLPALALEEVTYAYGAALVLGGVSLACAPGELTCLVGPNGSGKTTALRLAAGLLAPRAGRVQLGGQDPRRLPRRTLARRLAYLPQEVTIASPLTAGEVVLMGRYPHRPPFALETAEDVAKARDALARCDALALADRHLDELSGGERRRVLLAQAFCQEAGLLLLDEPTAALDPAHALELFGLLRGHVAAAGAALVVTHDLGLAARFADRLVVLADGRVVADGAPGVVLRSPDAAAAFGARLHVGTLPSGEAFVVPW